MRSLLVLPLLVAVALSYSPCDILRPSYSLEQTTSFDITGGADELATTEATCTWSSSFYNGPGVWYTFVAQVDGQLSLSTCETTWDTVLELEYGTCSVQYCVERNDDYSGCGPQNRGSYLLNEQVTQGNTYYLLLRPYASSVTWSDYTLHVDFVASEVLCPEGYLVTPTYDAEYYWTGFTSSFESTFSACSNNNVLGVWYSIEPMTSGYLSVYTCGSTFDTVLTIQKGNTCYDKSCVQTNDDSNYCTDSTRNSYLYIPVEANVVYDILLYPYSSLSETEFFALSIDFVAGSASVGSSEEVCPSYVQQYYYGDTVDGYISSYNYLDDGCWYGNYGTWYQFTPSYSRQADIYLCSDSYSYLYLIEGQLCVTGVSPPVCDAVAYASYYEYNDHCQGYAAHLSYYVTGGTTYYIMISTDYSSANFELVSGDYVSWSEDYSSYWWYSSSSHPWWWSSWDSDDSAAFWIIFVSVCCSLGMCLCCVGVLCFCIHLCRRRRAAKYQPVAIKMPEQPAIVMVTPQQPVAPQVQPQQQQQQQLQQLPQIVIPQQQLQQQQQQYMFVPYPYMYPAGGAQPAQLYPVVN